MIWFDVASTDTFCYLEEPGQHKLNLLNVGVNYFKLNI